MSTLQAEEEEIEVRKKGRQICKGINERRQAEEEK